MRLFMLSVACCAFAASGCAKKDAPAAAPPPLTGDFFVKPAAAPLWFEFLDGSVRPVSGPESATLYDFSPWAFVPHTAGIVPVNGGLVIAVNRTGFYELTPAPTDETMIAVRKAANSADFADFTVSDPFYFENRACVLLDNRDISTESALPSPKKRAWTFVPRQKTAMNVEIPAFSAFSPDDDWEIKHYFVTADRGWYFSAQQNRQNTPEMHFFRGSAPEIADGIDEISVEAFAQAAEPASAAQAPPVLRFVLAALADANAGHTAVVSVISPRFGGNARFAAGEGSEAGEFSGCYTEEAGPHALIVRTDGRLYEYPATGIPAALPALPKGCVWTAAAALGKILVAAWEERESWYIGTAGLIFVRY